MHSADEGVWQKSPATFLEQLSRARALKRAGSHIAAHVLFATAYYSHFSSQLRRNPVRALREFKNAKQNAQCVLYHCKGSEQELSHGQCDVVGTILLRHWLWINSDPELALAVLQIGLKKPDVPPHARALMTIGVAEGFFLIGDNYWCKEKIKAALAYEELLEDEKDSVQAYRQFSRVLRRAFSLRVRLGDDPDAEEALIKRAIAYANHPTRGSRDQYDKIQMESQRLRLPKLLQRLLPG